MSELPRLTPAEALRRIADEALRDIGAAIYREQVAMAHGRLLGFAIALEMGTSLDTAHLQAVCNEVQAAATGRSAALISGLYLTSPVCH